jgi:hypothetical protein
MKKTLIVALMMVAGIAQAGHPRCAGSYEPAKCEALEAKLAAETPEQRKASAQKLDASRQASMKEVDKLPNTKLTTSTYQSPKLSYGDCKRDPTTRFQAELYKQKYPGATMNDILHILCR